MGKTDETKHAEHFLYREYVQAKIGVYGCFEVTFGNRDVWQHGKRERVDFVTYDTDGIIRCYEIKVSKSDFDSDASLSFIGHYNYYVMPSGLYFSVKESIPNGIGVILHDIIDTRHRTPVKAKRNKVSKGTEVNIIEAMLKSLHREQLKLYQYKAYWEN